MQQVKMTQTPFELKWKKEGVYFTKAFTLDLKPTSEKAKRKLQVSN